MSGPYNYSKLLGKFRELGLSQADVASRIGVTPSTLNRKLSSHAQFRQTEIQAVMDLIDAPLDAVDEYFFAH